MLVDNVIDANLLKTLDRDEQQYRADNAQRC